MEPRTVVTLGVIMALVLSIDIAVAAAAVLWWRSRSAGAPADSAPVREWQRGAFHITSDRTAMDVAAIHAFLTRSYWSPGIERALVERAIRHSLCFGLFDGERQIGFARYATDQTRFAYLMDVYVLEEYRGQGLGQWLVACTLEHPSIARCRRLLLTTRDAHELYRRYGFTELPAPERWMERFRDDSPPSTGRATLPAGQEARL